MKKLFVSAAMLVLVRRDGSRPGKDLRCDRTSFRSNTAMAGTRATQGRRSRELDWLVSTADPTATFHPVLAHADFSYDDWITPHHQAGHSRARPRLQDRVRHQPTATRATSWCGTSRPKTARAHFLQLHVPWQGQLAVAAQRHGGHRERRQVRAASSTTSRSRW